MSARYVLGIDLGTTHSALAYAAIDDTTAHPGIAGIPQMVALGAVETRTLLPSFLYLAHESEGPRIALGPYTRVRGRRACAGSGR